MSKLTLELSMNKKKNHNHGGPHHHRPIIQVRPPPIVVSVRPPVHVAPPPPPVQVVPPMYPQVPSCPPAYQPPGSDAPGFAWISTTTHECCNLESRAVVAGHEGHDRSPIYVGRTWHEGEQMPCKVIPRHRAAYVAYNGREIPVHNFEVYCRNTPSVNWVPSGGGAIPAGAVPAGRTITGEPLYVGRGHYQGSLTPGKIHPSHKCLYIPFGGAEVSLTSYEVMVHVYN